jgi:hypothetical protein
MDPRLRGDDDAARVVAFSHVGIDDCRCGSTPINRVTRQTDGFVSLTPTLFFILTVRMGRDSQLRGVSPGEHLFLACGETYEDSEGSEAHH